MNTIAYKQIVRDCKKRQMESDNKFFNRSLF